MIDWDILLVYGLLYIFISIFVGIITYGVILMTQVTFGNIYGIYIAFSATYWLAVIVSLLFG